VTASPGASSHPAVALVESALETLRTETRLTEESGPASHTVLIGTGLETPAVTLALGQYLTGVLANIVQADARLSDELLHDWTNAQAELEIELEALLGVDNIFTAATEWKRIKARDPWIAEGVVHAMLVLRARTETALLPGKVHAVKCLHHRSNIPGIDLLAIYDDDVLAVMVGECKATKLNGIENLRKAAEFFKAVDDVQYAGALRQELATLLPVLAGPVRSRVSNALWTQRRCYVPAIAYADKFEPRNERSHLAGLTPPRTHRRLVAIELDDFDGFFNAIADAMRATVAAGVF